MRRTWDYPFTPLQHVRAAPKPEPTSAPFCNIRLIGDLTPGEAEWWLSFGRHLDEARKNINASGWG